MAGGLRGVAYRKILRRRPLTSLEVLRRLQTPSTRLRCVPPPSRTAPPPAPGGGETDASGLHGVDVAVGLARMLHPGVPLGRPDTTGWRGPLVKARPCKVKGLDPVVKRYRVRRDGGPGGGSNATGASYRALIHAGWCCGMSEEAARVSGAWPPSRTAPPPAPGGGKLPHRVYTEWI